MLKNLNPVSNDNFSCDYQACNDVHLWSENAKIPLARFLTSAYAFKTAISELPMAVEAMGPLADTKNWGFRMCRECRERFPRHRG